MSKFFSCFCKISTQPESIEARLPWLQQEMTKPVFQSQKVMRVDNLVLHHSVSGCVINKFVLLSVSHSVDCMLIRLPVFPCNNLAEKKA